MDITSRKKRKTLINPHTELLNNKPIGLLNLGEIGVEHSDVDSAKLYIETNPNSNSGNTIATFITENETKNYVNDKISGITEIISDILDIVITGATGDEIIKVNVDTPNVLSIKHVSGGTEDGFKKIETDSYGHIIGGEDVTMEDIANLSGFVETIQSISPTIKIDPTSESFLTLTEDGLKLEGVEEEINFVLSAITEEQQRAQMAEDSISGNVSTLVKTTLLEFERLDKRVEEIAESGITGGYIKSITETTEEETGNRILTFTDNSNNTTEIVETIIIDCGEY